MEKEGLGYVESIKHIIGKYRIDTSSVPDGPNLDTKRPEDPSESWVDLLRLRGALRERRARIPTVKYAALVTAWYMTAFEQSLGKPVGEKIKKLETKLGTL